jgi:hypothetical protein
MQNIPSLQELIPSLAPYLNGNGESQVEHSDDSSSDVGLSASQPVSMSSAQTGPKSPDGKAHSRLNRFRHGMDATDEVFLSRLLTPERAAYQKIRRTLVRFYSPRNAYETLLVDRMAIQHLRMLRLYRLESDAMDIVPNPKDKSSIIPHLDRFSRYDVRIEKQLRILHNRLILLKQTQADRRFKFIPTQE